MKKNFLIVFIICLFAIIEVYLSVSIAYFAHTKNASGNIKLGELDFSVKTNFEENMYALPNSVILTELILENKKENGEYENLIDFYFRFKIEGICNQNYVLINPILLQNSWYFDGEYYYYKNIVGRNQKVSICDNVVIDKNTGNYAQNKPMEINVCFEAIQYNAVADLWGENILQNLNNF